MPSYTSTTHIVFLDLPVELQNSLDEIRKIYNPEAVIRGKPHITLKQDEDFSISSEAIIKCVEAVMSKSLPLPIQLLGAKILKISPEKYMVYVGVGSLLFVQKVKQLSKILEQHIAFITEDAGNSTTWEQSKQFFPHITIALNLSNQEEANVVAQKVDGALKNFSREVYCTTVSVGKWSEKKWQILKTISSSL